MTRRDEGSAAGDEILRAILDGQSGSDGRLASRLLEEIGRGYDVAKLIPLLNSPDNSIASLGTYILAETGEAGRPLFEQAVILLSHRSPAVRGSAIDCVLAWSDLADERSVRSVLSALADKDASVRKKAINFIARVDIELLSMTATKFHDGDMKKSHLFGIQLLAHAGTSSVAEILAAASAPDEIIRRYAAACALRLRLAATSVFRRLLRTDDTAISDLANSYLK
jgi:hypothetical protein